MKIPCFSFVRGPHLACCNLFVPREWSLASLEKSSRHIITALAMASPDSDLRYITFIPPTRPTERSSPPPIRPSSVYYDPVAWDVLRQSVRRFSQTGFLVFHAPPPTPSRLVGGLASVAIRAACLYHRATSFSHAATNHISDFFLFSTLHISHSTKRRLVGYHTHTLI